MVTHYYSNTRSEKLDTVSAAKSGSWIHIVEPSTAELEELSDEFKLDKDLLSDALDPYESPRIERDGQYVYVYTRYCYPEGSDIATEPLLIIYGPNNIFTLVRINTTILDRYVSGAERVVTTQRTKTLLQFLGEVNMSYRRHLNKVSRRILSIRSQLHKRDISNQQFVSFIDVEEDLNEFMAALQPQGAMLRNLLNSRFLKLYADDEDLVEDLSLGTAELIDLTKSRLKTISNTREAYATIATNNLNRTFKRLTSLGIFLTIPTVVSSLLGMNVKLPLETDPRAFWYILGFIAALTTVIILFFRRKRWL